MSKVVLEVTYHCCTMSYCADQLYCTKDHSRGNEPWRTISAIRENVSSIILFKSIVSSQNSFQ